MKTGLGMIRRIHVRQVCNLSVVVMLVGGLLWVWNQLQQPETLPIKTVKVQATYDHIQKHTLIQAIQPYTEHGFFGIDGHLLRENLLRLPWVRQVAVTRVWPDTLLIDLTEHVAIARWGATGLLNKQGEIFPLDPKHPMAHLPLLEGPPQQEQRVWNECQQMFKQVARLGLKVTECHLSEQDAWSLVLSNGITVVLGRTEAQARLGRFVSLYREVIGDKAASARRVDMRYMDGMTVEWMQSANRN
jgi:cell division protein FtsQ